MANRRRNRPPPVPVVAVINMKGGVGKTTIAGNVFREVFRRRDKSTLLIDFDPQFNLSQLLLSQQQYENLRAAGRTMWSILEPDLPESVFTTSVAAGIAAVQVNADDYISVLKYMRPSGRQLCLLPGDFRLARFNLRESTTGLQTPRTQFRKLIESATNTYDLVVLDCNPSSSFLTRCALEAATHLVIPVRPDRFSVLGVQMIRDYLAGLPTLTRRPAISIVLNDIVRNEVSDIELDLRANPDIGNDVLVHRVPRSNLLRARSDYAGFAVDRKVSYYRTLRQRLVAVADELSVRLGL